jgi:hypothetical protein
VREESRREVGTLDMVDCASCFLMMIVEGGRRGGEATLFIAAGRCEVGDLIQAVCLPSPLPDPNRTSDRPLVGRRVCAELLWEEERMGAPGRVAVAVWVPAMSRAAAAREGRSGFR